MIFNVDFSSKKLKLNSWYWFPVSYLLPWQLWTWAVGSGQYYIIHLCTFHRTLKKTKIFKETEFLLLFWSISKTNKKGKKSLSFWNPLKSPCQSLLTVVCLFFKKINPSLFFCKIKSVFGRNCADHLGCDRCVCVCMEKHSIFCGQHHG